MQKFLKTLVLTTVIFGFGQARADWISVYAAGKFDTVNGTGNVFENLSPGVAGGVEAGFELIGIDVWGEAVWMANSQAMYSANLGFDLTFGTDFRVNIGAHTGPIFFEMGPAESDPFKVSNETASILDTARMANADVPEASAIEDAYNLAFGNQAGQLDSLAFGWNLIRGRLQVEYQVFPMAYLGFGGQYGQHITFSGDDVTAAAKSLAIDELAESDELKDIPEPLKGQLVDQLKEDLGAEEPNTDDMSGTNYNVGIYFKFEI